MMINEIDRESIAGRADSMNKDDKMNVYKYQKLIFSNLWLSSVLYYRILI